MRLRVYDFKNSRGPALVGLCGTDTRRICQYLDSAQRRLVLAREAGDEGWYGSWAEMVFQISRSDPYITTPRGIARIEKMAVCQYPVRVQNQFYEYLQFTAGPQPDIRCPSVCELQAYSRNNAVTFVQPTGGLRLRLYAVDTADIGPSRVLLQGLDTNNSVVRSQDGTQEVAGIWVTLEYPFVDCPVTFNRLDGIQKDITVGDVQLYEVSTTGTERRLLTMEPGEQVADYRRYYLSNLPLNCCGGFGVEAPVQISTMVKFDLLPVRADTDYLVIQNLEALIEEVQSIRLSEADNREAKQMAAEKHLQAVRLLQGELVHYLGKELPAMTFLPFGSARLECQKIGIMI